MAIPVSVVLDRGSFSLGGLLDLTPLVQEGSLSWATVVPGGFADCTFVLDGDPRRLLKQIPYLSILRVIADSGKVLFEGQIEDLSPSVSEESTSLKVGAFGLQNKLTEITQRQIWSKRDLDWQIPPASTAVTWPSPYVGGIFNFPNAVSVATGNMDPSDLTKQGLRFAGMGVALTQFSGMGAFVELPLGMTFQNVGFTYSLAGANTGVNKMTLQAISFQRNSTNDAASSYTTVSAGTATNYAPGSTSHDMLEFAFWNNQTGGTLTPVSTDVCEIWNIRILGTVCGGNEDDNTGLLGGGFYGGTILRQLLGLSPWSPQPGVIEDGKDFLIDHLDASTRRTYLDIIQEVSQYYAREWAVWEDNLFHWRTPNLTQPQWVVSTANLTQMELDASTVNSASLAIVLYTDAASGLAGEQYGYSQDRRSPYVLRDGGGGTKQRIITPGFPMTANTAAQFAALNLQDIGYGPVPASGSVTLPGETIVQNAQGSAAKAWEIRAGGNLTISDLPMADIFTQDGRGETLFHIVSTEANTSDGSVTLSLDSYGSKRSDVLMARLAAVTSALGG